MLQIGEAFTLIVEILRTEKDDFLVEGEAQFLACFLLVYVSEYVVWNAVVNVDHLSLRHSLLCPLGNPLTATDKSDITFLE